ncbi:hypothetical protein [Desulfofustis limnaeus]|nr:hypothetical protein [Desulfofustis limnaeus]
MKIYRLFAMFFALSILFSGCAMYPNLQEPSTILDQPIPKSFGRVVFFKHNGVGEVGVDKTELIATILSGYAPDEAITYRIFEYRNNTFYPIESFKHMRKNYPSFYIELPAGKHTFVIARTRTDFFVTHFVCKMAAVELTIEENKTYPIIFGIGKLFSSDPCGELLAYHYDLKDDDMSYIYDLRKQNISGNEREELISDYNQYNVAFNIAANAVAVMEKSNGPGEEFSKFTKERMNDLRKYFSEIPNEKISKQSFDIYRK